MRRSAGLGTLRLCLATLPPAELAALAADWLATARDDQLPPGTLGPDPGPAPWTTWLLVGGRGAGKTRAGAEWVAGIVRGDPAFGAPAGRIALVGESLGDAREVMIEGPSGLLGRAAPGAPRAARPAWSPTRRRLEWPNGAVAHLFSSEDPDSLRGPQFDAAWADEVGKWRHAEGTWDMLQFGLRLGRHPRQVVTTTPRPTPLIRRLLADPRTRVTRARTAANAANLSAAFLDAVTGRYAGTRLGRQELDGELVEERDDALWTRDLLEACRVRDAPSLARIVVAVDPPASSGRSADACGLVAAGADAAGTLYVLADETAQGLPPERWAARAAALYHRLRADALVVEVNQGGEMVAAVIGQVAPDVPVTEVRATRGKHLRAEPVAVLYARGRVRHVGAYPELEDEMCDLGPEGLGSGRSPDRLDALVWALTHLGLRPPARPRIRVL